MTENIDALSREQGRLREEQPTQKEILITIAKESCELFHHDMTPYARITQDGHKEVWPIASRTFRLFLDQQYHQITGGSPSSNARTEALSTIEALARFRGEEHPVYRRVARLGNKIVIDMGDSAWNVIEVSDAGWQILSESPVRFHRGKDAQSLPIPEKGGTLDDLWHFINIKSDDRLPFLAWLIFSLMPAGPFVILVLRAFHGSGKSTTSRYTIALIDPRRGGLRSFPKDERDLAIASTNGWFMAFDNLSHIPAFISDALCRLTHGAGFATRTLYENTEETIIDAKRPILLNSIGDIIDRPDLADRVLLLELPPLDGPRRTEAQIEADFQKKGPKIMGAILDLMAQFLRELPDVGYDGLPRMADFARVGIAVERVLGYPDGAFVAEYMKHREDLAANILDHPIVAALFKLLEGAFPSGWSGTFKELKSELENTPDADKYSPNWPKTSKKLGNDLRNMAPILKNQGLDLVFGGHTKKGSYLSIRKIRETQSPRSPQSPARTVAAPEGDHCGDRPKEQSPGQSPQKARTIATGDHGDDGDHSSPPFLFDSEATQFEEVD